MDEIMLKPENVYFCAACGWIGNHNYHVWTFLLLCEEEPDVAMVNEFFYKHGTYSENIQIVKYQVTSNSEYELLHLGSEERCINWENDLEKMLKKSENEIWIGG